MNTECDLTTPVGREEYFGREQALIEDQRFPWQREGWVDPYDNRLHREILSELQQHFCEMIRDELKLKEQLVHNWAKEGF